MTHSSTLKSLLAGTALTAAFALPGFAQTLNVDVAELEGKSAECQALGKFIADQDGSIAGVEPERVAGAVNNDMAAECADIERMLRQESGTAQDAATAQDPAQSETEAAQTQKEAEATTETVETSQDATIVGEARVRVPEPNVDVRVPQPEVTVRKAPPQVSVQDSAAQIEVQQAQPEIAVEIPTITVRVTMPAPSIYVLQADPQVSVTEADPQVEVVQGKPEITVTQPDPELDIDLGVNGDQQAAAEQSQPAQADEDSGDAKQVSGNVDLTQQQPVVSFVASEEQPQVDVTRADPEVSFSGAKPNVTITMAQEPTVDVQVAGEPQVTIETQEQRDQRRAGQQQAEGDNADRQAAADTTGQEPQAGQMTVGDLMDMAVVTADGEDLGNPEAVIESEGQQYLLLSSGGFMDIGDKIVPVPMGKVSVADDRLMLDNVTEEDVEHARDFEYDEDAALPEDQAVTMAN